MKALGFLAALLLMGGGGLAVFSGAIVVGIALLVAGVIVGAAAS